jgi:hypothetical protein
MQRSKNQLELRGLPYKFVFSIAGHTYCTKIGSEHVWMSGLGFCLQDKYAEVKKIVGPSLQICL